MSTPTFTPSGVTGAATSGTPGAPSGGSPSPSPTASPSPGSASGTPGSQGSATLPPSSPSLPPLVEGQPVPYERFKERNDLATRLSWAEGMDHDQVNQAVQLFEWYDRDPVGAHEYITGLLTRNGHLQQTPAPRTPQQAGRQDPLTDPTTGEPQPDIIVPETGQQLYSAAQQRKWGKWLVSQHDERLQQLEGNTAAQQTTNQARQMIAEAERDWPHFKTNAKDIFLELRKDKRLTLEGAYRRVVVQSGKLRTAEREALTAEMGQRANAGSGVQNPGAGTPQSTIETRKLPMKELLRREFAKRGITVR